jgi:hypothetical protein
MDPAKPPDQETPVTTALLADAAGWAQHFSIVRMTVTTFLIGLAIGIVSAKWHQFDVALCGAVWGLWLLALGYCFYFTREEAKRLVAWRDNLNRLLPHAGLTQKLDSLPRNHRVLWGEIYPGRWDPALLMLLVATAGLVVLTICWAQVPPAGPQGCEPA